ncbi:hypothetical protein [Pedobacter aquatilis]|uniref:hypothetical protein n=1 Tax=Pedobacter aquatilis TaxID=351343 RepID=UPI00293164FA|nr:hypothetical protein [Pedobacter aquatilis]
MLKKDFVILSNAFFVKSQPASGIRILIRYTSSAIYQVCIEISYLLSFHKQFKYFFLSGLYFFAVSDVFASEGCGKNIDNSSSEIIYSVRIMPNISGFQNYTGPIIYNTTGYPSACPNYNFNDAEPQGTRCCINGDCNPLYEIIIYTPLVTNCPIDDYIEWLIIPVGIVGLFHIKRRGK